MSSPALSFPRRRAFTLVELIVVIGIIALLIALLLPALSGARRQANSVKCQANLRSIGQLLLIYADQNQGWIYPIGPVVTNPTQVADYGKYMTFGDLSVPYDSPPYPFGTPIPKEQRWPVYVFDPPVWNPRIMLCPQDMDPMPAEEHSYVLNHHIEESPKKSIKWGPSVVIGRTSTGEETRLINTEVVLMGEKKSMYGDYYMEANEFNTRVEPYRHGLKLGSNYLYLDLHVDLVPPEGVAEGLDPWDPTPTKPTVP